MADAAKAAGADMVGFEDLIEDISGGNTDFDVRSQPDAVRSMEFLPSKLVKLRLGRPMDGGAIANADGPDTRAFRSLFGALCIYGLSGLLHMAMRAGSLAGTGSLVCALRPGLWLCLRLCGLSCTHGSEVSPLTRAYSRAVKGWDSVSTFS